MLIDPAVCFQGVPIVGSNCDPGPLLANEPNRPWTTQAAGDLQLDEIEGADTLDRDRFAGLQDFYRQRISEVS